MARILFISARSDIGGGPAHMYELARGLNPVDTFIALPTDGYFYNEFLCMCGSSHVWEIPRQRFALQDLWRLTLLCRKHQVDLIHSHGKGAGVYSRAMGFILGVPIIHTLHGYHDGRYSNLGKRLYALWEKLAGLVTSKVICVSNSEASLFQAKVGISYSKLAIIPNGTPIPRDLNTIPSARKIVTVARFDYQKNLLEFLAVAERLPQYNFYLIGDGADRSEIECFIKDRNILNVNLCGESHTVLSDISDADVYLTTARWEGLPLAVIEAMSLGIPVVASDVVGNRDAVKESLTGFLYPLGDISACVEAIKKASHLDRVRIKMHHRDEFSSERMVAKTIDLYGNVLRCRN